METNPYSSAASRRRALSAFLLCNYLLLGAASGCIFLTLSLRLLPSLAGLSLVLLHAIAAAGAVSGCVATRTGRWYGIHMVVTVLTAIFVGAAAVLVLTRTGECLVELKSYVKEEDAVVILKMVGGLSVVMFCLEWAVMGLAFLLSCCEEEEEVEEEGSGKVWVDGVDVKVGKSWASHV